MGVGEDACGDPAEERRAERRPLLRRSAFQRQVEDGGDDPEPEVAPRPAAGTRADAGSTPSRRRSSRESRSPNATPSSTARTSAPRLWRSERPAKAARALGSTCGVRSPARYGRNVSPSTPGGHGSASATTFSGGSPCATTPRSQPSDPAAESITPIACQPPDTAWQNAWTRPSGSAAKPGSAAKTTPEVPSTTESGPGPTTPTPSAPAAWSPAPAATGTPSAVWPETAGDSSAVGSHSRGISSASMTSSLQARAATSKSSVPDASATSVACSPVSRRRM